MRTKLIAGNWKMNTTLADAHILAGGVRSAIESLDHIEVVLCPPSIWLTELAHEVIPRKRLPHLKLGAQNMYYAEEGAFTGEISPLMVKEVAEYVLVGHSERTHIFKETPEIVNAKLRSAFDHGLIPILCIGEDEVVPGSRRHIVHLLNHLTRDVAPSELSRLVVAYEPVWAIGSGTPATAEYAQDMIAVLREQLTPQTRILYGGSVTDQNSEAFLAQPDIDGFLIGGTSLKLKPFVRICQQAETLALSAHRHE